MEFKMVQYFCLPLLTYVIVFLVFVYAYVRMDTKRDSLHCSIALRANPCLLYSRSWKYYFSEYDLFVLFVTYSKNLSQGIKYNVNYEVLSKIYRLVPI